MRNFKPTYLYIKTHNKTGFKYFGKTIKDPYKYKGSGKIWINHLKVHGNDVTTQILGYFIDYDECKQVALEFSIEYNIVESNQWANLMVETLDGGFIPNSITPEARAKASKSLRENGNCKGWHGITKLCKDKGTLFTLGMLGKKHSDETKIKMNVSHTGTKNSQYGTIWINNGSICKKIKKEELIPDGWNKGRRIR